eukprot:6195074-Amphidinium_carterae.1
MTSSIDVDELAAWFPARCSAQHRVLGDLDSISALSARVQLRRLTDSSVITRRATRSRSELALRERTDV